MGPFLLSKSVRSTLGSNEPRHYFRGDVDVLFPGGLPKFSTNLHPTSYGKASKLNKRRGVSVCHNGPYEATQQWILWGDRNLPSPRDDD